MGLRATNTSKYYDGACTKLHFVYGFVYVCSLVIRSPTMDSWYEFFNSVYAEVYFADNWSPMTMTISQLGESRVASMTLSCFVTFWVTAKVGKIQN